MVFTTLVELVVGFLVTAFGLCVTLHLAARYLLGPVPATNAVAGVAPAVAIVVLSPLALPLAAIVAIAVDFLAVRWAYDLSNRRAGLLTIGHVTVSVLLAFALSNITRLVLASS